MFERRENKKYNCNWVELCKDAFKGAGSVKGFLTYSSIWDKEMQAVCTSLRNKTSQAPDTGLMVVFQFNSLMQRILVLSHKGRMIIQSFLPPKFSLKLKFFFWTGVEAIIVYSTPHVWSELSSSIHPRRGVHPQVLAQPIREPNGNTAKCCTFWFQLQQNSCAGHEVLTGTLFHLSPLLLGPSRQPGNVAHLLPLPLATWCCS